VKLQFLSRLIFFFALTSCSIYQSHFDCQASPGVGCTSVHEVLDLIVEKEGAEDLFIKDSQTAHFLKEIEKEKRHQRLILQKAADQKLFLLKENTGTLVIVQKEA
jgi:hypothetical protein